MYYCIISWTAFLVRGILDVASNSFVGFEDQQLRLLLAVPSIVDPQSWDVCTPLARLPYISICK